MVKPELIKGHCRSELKRDPLFYIKKSHCLRVLKNTISMSVPITTRVKQACWVVFHTCALCHKFCPHQWRAT